MSDTRSRARSSGVRLAILVLLLVAAFLPPLYLNTSLLQIGLFVFSSAVAAVGLTLLSGTAGQLSLGHSFFFAVGAYGYAILAGSGSGGAGLPSAVAALCAVALAGVAGALFSPVSARIRGLYLGVATLALVYLGQHLLANVTGVTGGYNGLSVPPLRIGGVHFADDSGISLLGVPLGQNELLWILSVLVLGAVWWFARGVITGRQGRALAVMRDSEIAAAVMGVDVRRAKTGVFVLSSALAGLGGVLYALTVSQIVPDSFSLALAINFLAMVVIGGQGVVGGAVAGALIVTGMPLLFNQYAGSLPFLSGPGASGLTPNAFAQYIYGALVVLMMLFESDGLAAVGRRMVGAARRRRSTGPQPSAPSADTDPSTRGTSLVSTR